MSQSTFDKENDDQKANEHIAEVDYQPQTAKETVRQGGLAWSAGIVFFSSIVFMLILGWGADLLLASTPWGLVGGVVIGSVIGFVQFFRLASKIFPQRMGPAERPLMPPDDEDT